MLGLSFLLAAAAGPSAASPEPPDIRDLSVFATYTAYASFQPGRIQVDIGTTGGVGPDRRYWFIRSPRDRGGKRIGRSDYTSSTLCPQAMAKLRDLEHLDMPRPDVPGTGDEETVIVLDGVLYTLRGWARHADGQLGEYSIESNVGSPLARWIDSMSDALEQCWRPLPKR
jgi:hypothetical protein